MTTNITILSAELKIYILSIEFECFQFTPAENAKLKLLNSVKVIIPCLNACVLYSLNFQKDVQNRLAIKHITPIIPRYAQNSNSIMLQLLRKLLDIFISCKLSGTIPFYYSMSILNPLNNLKSSSGARYRLRKDC